MFFMIIPRTDIYFWIGEQKEIFFTYKVDDVAQVIAEAEFRIKPESGDEVVFNSSSSAVVTINEDTKKVRVFFSKVEVNAFDWRRGEWALYLTEPSERSFRVLYGGVKVLSPYENP